MQTFTTIADLRAALAPHRLDGRTIGLVPTMGYLHVGHMELARRARADNDIVVATIFVNPLQFGANEDLARYPRDLARDQAMLEAEGVHYLFAPGVEDMYPQPMETVVDVPKLGAELEGSVRPGHFAGVATVVTKLFNIASPDRAYFGEKDFQQLQMIRRLARDLDIPVEIVGVPTLREVDGLAMSSRNRYLNDAERKIAAALPQMLAESAARLKGGAAVEQVLGDARARLLAAGFASVDYVALCDETLLQPIDRLAPGARLFVAAHLGRTRLIDNWAVG